MTLANIQTVFLKGKFPAKLDEEIPWNNHSIYLIILYKICREGINFSLIIKYVMTINPVTGWFEIIHYNEKNVCNDRKLSRHYVADQVTLATVNHA